MTITDYKNASRRILITMIIASLSLVIFTASIIFNAFNKGELYTMKGVVTEVDTISHLTTFTDTKGESWRFKGIKDWTVGDSIKLTIHSNNTEDFHDDKVIGANKIKGFKEGIN